MEWLAFSWGVKPALRLWLPPAQAEVKREEALALGASVEAARQGEAVILYMARSAAEARALRDAEAPLLSGDAPAGAQRAAHLALGRRLGYPRCCVEAYAETLTARGLDGRHEDYVFAEAALARSSVLHARLNFFRRATHRYLVPFYPCAFDCDWALRYATGTEEAIARRARPGDAARLLEALTERILLGPDGVPRPDPGAAAPPGVIRLWFDAP